MKIVCSKPDGYWFLLRHGLRPGTLPKDVSVLEVVEDGWKDYVKLDRFLTTEELKYYDVREAAPQTRADSATNTCNGFSADLSNCLRASYVVSGMEQWTVYYYDPKGELIGSDDFEAFDEAREQVKFAVRLPRTYAAGDSTRLVEVVKLTYQPIAEGREEELFYAEFNDAENVWIIDVDKDNIVDDDNDHVHRSLEACDNSILAMERVPDHDLEPPEYADPKENEYQEDLEVTLTDVAVEVFDDLTWIFTDSTYSWAKNPKDRRGDWPSSEYYMTLADYEEVVDDITYLLEDKMPGKPGKYLVSCDAYLMFDVNVPDYGYDTPDGWESDVDTSDAEISFNFKESKISNFKCIPTK